MQNEKEEFKKNFIKRLVRFSIKIIRFSEKLKEKKVFYSIIDQLIRNATSIGANVIEAKSSSSKKDYIHFFEIALKSTNETIYWLIVIRESFSEFNEDVAELLREANELSKILGSSILTLKGKN